MYLINVTINETTYQTDYDSKSLIEFLKFRKRNYSIYIISIKCELEFRIHIFFCQIIRYIY